MPPVTDSENSVAFPTTRTMLAEFISKKQAGRQSVSIRLFARNFGVSAAYLSRILAGKRKIPLSRVEQICERVDAPKEWKKLFKLVAAYEGSKSAHQNEFRKQIETLTAKHPEYTMVSDACFQIICGWQHGAIIELTKLKGFKSEPAWIAARLGISVMDTHLAIDRLLRFGLLIEQGGRLKASAAGFSVPDVSSSAIRQFHEMMLSKALHSLRYSPVEKRNFQSSIVATSQTKILEANQRINDFIDDLTRWLESGEQDCLYAIGIQAFPIEKMQN
jgi:uncharacterized protein (TIGR02147 family)